MFCCSSTSNKVARRRLINLFFSPYLHPRAVHRTSQIVQWDPRYILVSYYDLLQKYLLVYYCSWKRRSELLHRLVVDTSWGYFCIVFKYSECSSDVWWLHIKQGIRIFKTQHIYAFCCCSWIYKYCSYIFRFIKDVTRIKTLKKCLPLSFVNP